MNLRLNLLLVVIVALLAGWYFSQQQSDKADLAQLIKKDGMPEYVGNRVTTSTFDLAGKPQYWAEAKEIKRYEHSEKTEFIQSLLNLFDPETALKQWQLSAEKAEITKDKMLYLTGNVKLESLDPTSRLQKLSTERLAVNLATQDIESDSLVTSTGIGFTTVGKGLKGNLKQQIATLKEDVKTFLTPNQLKPSEKLPSESP